MQKRYRTIYGLCWSLISPLDKDDKPFSIPLGSIVTYVGENTLAGGQKIVYLSMNGTDFWITKQNFDFGLVEVIG